MSVTSVGVSGCPSMVSSCLTAVVEPDTWWPGDFPVTGDCWMEEASAWRAASILLMTGSMLSGLEMSRRSQTELKVIPVDGILSPLAAEQMQAVAMTEGGTWMKSGSGKERKKKKNSWVCALNTDKIKKKRLINWQACAIAFFKIQHGGQLRSGAKLRNWWSKSLWRYGKQETRRKNVNTKRKKINKSPSVFLKKEARIVQLKCVNGFFLCWFSLEKYSPRIVHVWLNLLSERTWLFKL